MKKFLSMLALLVFSSYVLISCNDNNQKENADLKVQDTFVIDHYDKKEVSIKMRDGISLHTTIYSPKDQSKAYPIVLKRTPYSCKPYGENEYPSSLGPNKYMMDHI